jgi:hypothetical protein
VARLKRGGERVLLKRVRPLLEEEKRMKGDRISLKKKLNDGRGRVMTN